MRATPEFPPTIELNGRKFVPRSRFEHYKKRLIARAIGAPDPDYEEPAVEEFVPLARAAKELGSSRRTIGRRMVERAPEPAAA
jgi:hypothetical protein